MQVPLLDLNAVHQPIRAQLLAAIGDVIDASAYAGGPFVAAFERDFAAFCGTRHAAGVGNGTDALWLALLALGIGPGDEVITVPGTFIATAEAITYCGATPVFIDIDERTYTMDPALIEAAITPRTKAVIPVHLFGQMADMDRIMAVARRHGLYVIEDACQAHGAEFGGRKAGSIGDAGAFSFYPGKNLGALGEAGALVTNSDEIFEKVKMLRDHGQEKKYHHACVGWNARMDGIQGAVLRLKLSTLAAGNAARRGHAARYDQLLAPLEVVLPQVAAEALHVYHIYAIRVRGRDELLRALGERGVACGVHYPIPVHLQPAYESLGYRAGSFPVAEQCAREFLSLPMFPDLSAEQLDHVVATLGALLAEAGAPAMRVA